MFTIQIREVYPKSYNLIPENQALQSIMLCPLCLTDNVQEGKSIFYLHTILLSAIAVGNNKFHYCREEERLF